MGCVVFTPIVPSYGTGAAFGAYNAPNVVSGPLISTHSAAVRDTDPGSKLGFRKPGGHDRVFVYTVAAPLFDP